MTCIHGYPFGAMCLSKTSKASGTLSEVTSGYAAFVAQGLAPFPVEAEPVETAEETTIPDSFVPPKEVQDAAKRGLELRRKYNRGGTEVGVARARDLSNGKGISLDTLKRMNSYFSRHEVDKKGMGWGSESNPSAGFISWLLWGNDAGWQWAKTEIARVEKLQAEKAKTDMEEYPLPKIIEEFERVTNELRTVANCGFSETDLSRVVELAVNLNRLNLKMLGVRDPEFRSLIHKVVRCGEYDVGLEYRPGEVRFPGKGYAKKLKCGYGHLRGFKGSDKMALDAYVHPSAIEGDYPDGKLYAVEQIYPDSGEFDELKIMFGFPSIDEAKSAYLSEMPEKFFGNIREIGGKELEQYRKSPEEPEPEADLKEPVSYRCKIGYPFGAMALSKYKHARGKIEATVTLAQFLYQGLRSETA